MAQTTDGWLWFGSPDGLHRFDGIRFEQVWLQGRRSRAIATLLATPAAELWIGFARGGASVLRGTRLTHFDETHGLISGSIMDFERGVDGEIWAVGSSGVARFDGVRWQVIDEAWGVARASASNVKLDAHGTLWLCVDRQLMFLPRGARKFQSSGIQSVGDAEFQQTPDGRMWYSDRSGTRLLPGQEGIAADGSWRNGATSYVSMFDQDGALWGFSALGVMRQSFPMSQPQPVKSTQAPDVFNEQSGLSGLLIRTLMEDREGNIWVTTASGVDRFRHTNVVPLPLVERLRSPSAIAAEPGGRLWITVLAPGDYGNYDDLLFTYEDRLAKVVAPIGSVTVLYKHPDGSIWFGGPRGIWRREAGRFVKLADPPEGASDEIYAMTPDASGSIWASFVNKGLQRFRSGVWEPKGNIAQLPDRSALALAADATGRTWIAYRDHVALIDGEHWQLYGPDQGVNVGQPAALSVGSHVLLAGEYGLQVLVDDGFVALGTAEEGSTDRVTGVLETKRGDLWWVGARGAVHVQASDLQHAIETRTYQVKGRIFDAYDGFPGASRVGRPNPVIAEAPDGRIWFDGSAGIAFIDPRTIRTNPIAPVPWIRSVTVDGKTLDSTEQRIVLQGARDIQIDYTGVNFSLPEQTTFKYRLEGFDTDWHNAATLRQASYTKLPPGEYVFRLSAANEAGVWGAQNAALAVVVPAAFYETWWFRMVVIALIVALLWLMHRLVLRQQTASLTAEHRARANERERIARDLHDTLLQAMQGMILRLHSLVARDVPIETMRKYVAGALDDAEELLEQGRDRVQQIAGNGAPEGLQRALMQTAERFLDPQATWFEFQQSGNPWDLPPRVHREALAIGREAVINACKHARASKIRVEIQYGASDITIKVSDDGHGIANHILEQGGKQGHFGLQSMRQRAEEIRARLEISSAQTSGTCILLTVPKHAC